MAASGCFARLCAPFVPKQWLSGGRGAYKKLHKHLFRDLNCPAFSTTSSRCLLFFPAASSSLAPRECTVWSRRVHSASAVFKDVSLDENPFYEKYQEKLEKIEGCVTCVWVSRISVSLLTSCSSILLFSHYSLPLIFLLSSLQLNTSPSLPPSLLPPSLLPPSLLPPSQHESIPD